MNYGDASALIESMLDTVDVELSGHCNADCVFCPRDKMTREQAIMTTETFEALLREISVLRPDGPRFIFFCGIGEPLLNRNLCSFAERVNQMFPNTLIVVVSNGSELNKETCDAILSGGIYMFSCSMNEIRKDRYDATMRGPNFDSVMRWMTYLAERKCETGLQVHVTYIRTIQTDHEIEEYLNFWHKLGVQAYETKLHNRGGFLDVIGADETRPRESCSLFNSRLFVAANGEVLACCHDLDGQSQIGKIGIDSLHSILNRKIDLINERRLFQMCSKCNDKAAVPVEGQLYYTKLPERGFDSQYATPTFVPLINDKAANKIGAPKQDDSKQREQVMENRQKTIKLDIACGKNKKPGFTGVDIWEGADIVCNLEQFPWPFEDDSVDEIFCHHYIEHTPDLISFVNELYRIMKVGAKAELIAPYYSSIRAWQDPTHLRAISEATFYYFNKEWRFVNKLDQYPITADFDIDCRYIMEKEWLDKDGEELKFAIKHYINVVHDILAILTKPRPSDDTATEYLIKAKRYWENSEFERAQSVCKGILNIEKNLDAYLMIGEYEIKNEEYAKAVNYFREAAAIAPESFEAHAGLVRSLIGSGQKDAAIAHMKEVGKDEPDLAQILETLISE